MSDTTIPAGSGLYRRIVRRETHSPRSTPAIVLAVVATAVVAWVGTECVLRFAGQPALLVDPADAVAAAVALPASVETAVLVASGAVVGLIGLVLVLVAVLPGRRANHVGHTGRTALVVDNRAIASALARTAARAAGVGADQVVVSVARRVAEVRVSRSSGWPVDESSVTAAVTAELARLDLAPSISPRVIVERRGVVGA
jgi:hypothetical protein